MSEVKDLLAELKKLDLADVKKIVTEIANNAITSFKKEAAGSFSDALNFESKKWAASVARKSWHSAQKWCKWTDDAFLFPDYTRFYYRKGKTEVVVQEFAPQIRLVKFRSDLVDAPSVKEKATTKSEVRNYSLSLPYVVFVTKFREGKFSALYVAFSDKPLKSLDQQPYKPFLSNINNTLQVCLGVEFKHSELITGNITQQLSYVLDYFWSSVFSTDWSQYYWEYLEHFEKDKRISSVNAWQESSIQDPLFVIDDVKWLPCDTKEFSKIVIKALEDDPDNGQFKGELHDIVANEFVDHIKEVVGQKLDEIQNKANPSTEKLIDQMFTALKDLKK